MSNAPSQEVPDEPEWRRYVGWAERVGLSGKLALALALAAAVAFGVTYAVGSGAAPLEASPQVVLGLLVIDLILLLSLGTLLAPQLVRLWVERRTGSAGSRLHTRFVGLFATLAAAPAIVTAIFSAVFLNMGIDAWFNDRVRTAVEESLAIADAYVEEHRNAMRADLLAMANDLNAEAYRIMRQPQVANRVLQAQAAVRSFSEATLFTRTGKVLARVSYGFLPSFETVPPEAMEQASKGEVLIFRRDEDDDVQGLIRLVNYADTYLYVSRFVDPLVVNHVERARDAVREYHELDLARLDVQFASALMFIAMALLLMMIAVWLALLFANRLVRPIGGLVQAAERVRQGDLAARVTEGTGEDEIGTLARAFNRMTSQLESQRRELVEANRQLDRRRRFTEAVLGGVSAGVVGLDRDDRIHLPNRSAALLLETSVEDLVGRPLAEAVPELMPLVAAARARPDGAAEAQIVLQRHGRRRDLLARASSDAGMVITFDDITALMAAQRAAAWADVARRIAHEIKNPLTPIQLAAERLRRKYARQVTTDVATFNQCTDTIIRQVADIGRMVDEFSAFARMPAPSMRAENLAGILREVLFDRQMSHAGVTFGSRLADEPLLAVCDRAQIARLLTNLVKNAAESALARSETTDEPGWQPGVVVRAERSGGRIRVSVSDNGTGFPAELRERLTEPYVTTRSKGTGLGLAIARKIAEDHGGRLQLDDPPGGGAEVSFDLAVATETADTAEREHAKEARGTVGA